MINQAYKLKPEFVVSFSHAYVTLQASILKTERKTKHADVKLR